MNPVIDPFTHKLVNGPEAGQNTEVDGFTVGFTGSTDGTVYNAGSGLTLTGNVFAADVAAVGFGMELAGGTASLARYRAVETVSGSSVTMQAGHAYKIYATSSAITLNTETIPDNFFGLEGHLEIFVSGTGYVVTGSNVVLANALEPDSVNNCTVRFHDGLAIISVEDHVTGYIVVSATGTTAGTLPYALTSATQEYVAFDASLNGATVSLSGSTANGEKHIVGNGYADTTLTGAVDCGTSKFTVANLGLNNVQVTGGTMTLGDVNIPAGSTLAVSGGGLAVEKVTGNGGVIDLGGNTVVGNGSFSEVTLSGGTFASGTLNAVGGAVVELEMTSGTSMIFANSNTVELVSGTSANITLASGAILDLTGNTNATPFAPGGGITFASGGATVLYSSGAVSGSYMMDNVTLLAGAKLTNTAVVDLGGGTGTRASCLGFASGISIISGAFRTSSGGFTINATAYGGGVLTFPSGTSAFDSILSSGGFCYAGGEAYRATIYNRGGVVVNNGGVANDFAVSSGGSLSVLSGGTANEPTINSGGSLVVSSGGTALLVTSNTGAVVTVKEGGYITYKE